jgi:MFS family permease
MIYNVVPGIFMSIAILWYLGALKVTGGKGADRGMNVGEVMRGFVGLLQNKTLMLLSTSSAFRAMTQSSLMVFVPLYLAHEMGYSAWAIGAAMMALQLMGFIAAPIAGAMSDKVGRRNIMMMSLLMTGVVILFMVFAGGTPMFVVLVAFLGTFLFAIRAVLQAWTLDATPKGLGGSAIGLLFGIQAIGGATGPLICGFLADNYGLLSTFYFMAGTVIFANMFIFFMPDMRAPAAA